MINQATIPSDKKGKEEHLYARKTQLLELATEILSDEITTFSQVNGYIWNTIEEIDGLLNE
jgi:hypothetical protein